MIFRGFIDGTYQNRSLNIAAQRTINLFPELLETKWEKNEYGYHRTPGFSLFADLSSYTFGSKLFVVRGATTAADRLFVTSGTDFLEISSIGGVTDRGNILGGNLLGQIASNGDELFLSNDGAAGYTFTLATNTLSAAISGVSAGF